MSPLRSLSLFFLTFLFLYVDATDDIITIPTHRKVVVCYVIPQAMHRRGDGKFLISDAKSEHCTHLIYAFATLKTTTWEIQSLNPSDDLTVYGNGTYKIITSLRDNYPQLKVLISIGGWKKANINLSVLAASKFKRENFINSVIRFLREYKFDGLDLYLGYFRQQAGTSKDKKNFALLVEELQNSLSQHDYILTAAISSSKAVIDKGYDIPKMSKYLDYIHVRTYDYHGIWDKQVLPNAPLYSTDNHDVDATIKHLLELGVPPTKLVLGLPLYGRTYLLVANISQGESPIGKSTQSKSFSGNYTSEKGFMGFNEICQELSNPSWISGWDNVSNTPYAVNGQRVICYDNDDSLYKKVLYANKKNLAGVMVWSLDMDDFRGNCGDDYILMKSINKALKFNEIVSTTQRTNTGTFLSPNPVMYKWCFISFLLVFCNKIFI